MNCKKFIKTYKSQKAGFNLETLMGEVNINLGCGNNPLPGFINTDFYNKKHADKVFDLDKELPFEAESCDLIYSDNVFEHLDNFLGVIDRCHQCLKHRGHLVIKVPYFKSKHAFVDPTHVRFFTIQSLDYFVRDTYFNSQYQFSKNDYERLEIFLDPRKNNFLRNLLTLYAIKRPNKFENNILSSLFVFHNITFVLRK